jgi:hypothetical protein
MSNCILSRTLDKVVIQGMELPKIKENEGIS